MVHPPRQPDPLGTVRGLLSCPLIHHPVPGLSRGRCPRVRLYSHPWGIQISGSHIFTPVFRSGGQRDLIRCPSELRCLTRVKACPSVEKLGLADGQSPRSIQDCPRVSLLWKPVPLESTIFLGSPDYISERDLIRCPSELRCLTRVKACPSVEKLGLADGRIPRSIFLDPFYLSVPVPVPVPGSKSVPDSARRVRSHRSDSILLRSLRFQIPYWTETDYYSWRPFQFPDPSPFQIPSDESDPIDPTRFYFLVYGSRFHTGPRLIALVGGTSHTFRFRKSSPIPSIRLSSTF